MSSLINSIVNRLLEDTYYHATRLSALPDIAAGGLQPRNTGRGNFGDFERHSKGKLFVSRELDRGVEWADLLDLVDKDAPVLLRVDDQQKRDYKTDWAEDNENDAFTTKSVKPSKLHVYTPETGWTPVGAHHPELFSKLASDQPYIPPDTSKARGAKFKGQMSLFPLDLYRSAVEDLKKEQPVTAPSPVIDPEDMPIGTWR
jgi:hypothetical protein